MTQNECDKWYRELNETQKEVTDEFFAWKEKKIQKSLLKQLVRIAYGCVIQSLSTIIPFNLRITPIEIGQIKAEQRICT